MKLKEGMEYKIDIKNKIVVKEISGNITINNIIQLYKTIFEDNNFSNSFNFFIDIRKSKSSFEINELEKIGSFFSLNTEKLNDTKMAFLTETPRQIVEVILFQDLAVSINLNILCKPFSTIETAYKWLNYG